MRKRSVLSVASPARTMEFLYCTSPIAARIEMREMTTMLNAQCSMFNGDRPRRRWHVCALNIRASAAKRLRRGLAVARVNLTTGGGGKHGSLTRSILLRRERSEGGFTFVE